MGLSRDTKSNPVARVYVSTLIADTLKKGGFKPTIDTYQGQAIVDVIDPKSKIALTYLVAKEGVSGPNPSNHEGTTMLDAMVQNVMEDLGLVGLSYNKGTGIYEGDFHAF